jgi:hypothetical protein
MLWKSPLLRWMCGLGRPDPAPAPTPLGSRIPECGSWNLRRTQTLFPKNQNLRRRRGGILPKREVMSKRNSNELAARLHRRPQLFHSRVVRVNRAHLDPFPISRKRFCAEEENQQKTTLHVLRSRRADMRILQIVEFRRGRQCLRDSHRLRRRYPCGKLLQGIVDQGSGTTCGAIVDLFALGTSLSGRANS